VSAATQFPHVVAPPTPLFTRHMVGVTEAERDRRLQGRVHGVHRYTAEPPRPVVLKLAA
jgi:hypothetical protein